MTLPITKAPPPRLPDVDELLQDSYLLVVELQQGASLLEAAQLREQCVGQIRNTRDQLMAAGMSQVSVDHISHAQCALLDETILSRAKDEVHAAWAGQPLQAQFFNRHQAGEFLYEEMRALLGQPAPDLQVLTVYHRVLMLGFRGRYREAEAPERDALLAALTDRVAPLAVRHKVTTQRVCTAGFFRRTGRARLAHWWVPGLLVAATWWGLDQYLGSMVATLLAAQA